MLRAKNQQEMIMAITTRMEEMTSITIPEGLPVSERKRRNVRSLGSISPARPSVRIK